MEIIDAQVHTWYPDTRDRPWDPAYRLNHSLPHVMHAGNAVNPEEVLINMASAGVDAAILSPIGVYGNNNDVELEAATRYPTKFAVMSWVDHLSPTVAEDIARMNDTGFLKSVRIIKFREEERRLAREFDAVLNQCAELGLPVAVSLVQPLLPSVEETFRAHPDVRFIIDHLGVGYAPPIFSVPPGRDSFEYLPSIIDLASLPNVNIKLTGVPALSKEVYPFRDVWDPVSRIVDAYGVERVHWGTDFTRVSSNHSYWEGVKYLMEMDRFTDDELAQLYGQSLLRTLNWDRSLR